MELDVVGHLRAHQLLKLFEVPAKIISRMYLCIKYTGLSAPSVFKESDGARSGQIMGSRLARLLH